MFKTKNPAIQTQRPLYLVHLLKLTQISNQPITWQQLTAFEACGHDQDDLLKFKLSIRTGDLHHGCTADKVAATLWRCHVKMDQNLWSMFAAPCWICTTKNEGSCEGKRWSNPVLASYNHNVIDNVHHQWLHQPHYHPWSCTFPEESLLSQRRANLLKFHQKKNKSKFCVFKSRSWNR